MTTCFFNSEFHITSGPRFETVMVEGKEVLLELFSTEPPVGEYVSILTHDYAIRGGLGIRTKKLRPTDCTLFLTTAIVELPIDEVDVVRHLWPQGYFNAPR